jgi:SPP1 gp7 family putative phage head morphogenesis protein
LIETDFRQHPAMQEVQLQQMISLVQAADGAILSVNATHEWLGIDPDPDPSSDKIRQSGAPPANPGEPGNPRAPGKPSSGPNDEQPASNQGRAAGAAPADRKVAAASGPARPVNPSREQMRRQANANLSRYEGKMQRAFVRVFDAQEQRCLKAAEAQRHEAKYEMAALFYRAIAVQIEDQIQPSDDDQQMLDALFEELIQERGDEALADLGLEATLNLNNRRAAEFVKTRSAKALSETSATTTNLMRERLAEVTAAGGDFSAALSAIRSVFADRRANAVTIARTETAGAYNGATWYAWQQSGVVAEQEWLTVGDDLVREAHQQLDGQRATLGEGWNVDGVTLMYPGDPNGPPDLVINCRCVAQPVLEDAPREAKAESNGHMRITNRVARWLVGLEA